MADDEIAMELMLLHKRLRSAIDPDVKAEIRRQIDLLLDHSQNVLPASYAGVDRSRRL
jgi:hypothetical protein